MTTIKLLALTALALAACGDNKNRPDAATRRDAAAADAQCSQCPVAPALGAVQLDRMARPIINSGLNRTFEPDADAVNTAIAKDAYNADSTPPSWPTSYTADFIKSLAILDSLDSGYCGNGLCEIGETGTSCTADCTTSAGQVGASYGCGNQVMYDTSTHYGELAGLLAIDELYLDTSKTTCGLYLAVEFGVVTGGENMTCGGRAPQYDVVDFSLSAMSMGLRGFIGTMFTPVFGDNVGPHTDYLQIFPYLGTPHS